MTEPSGASGQKSLTVVIVVDHASVTGGLAKVALESAIGLKRAGHRPIVYAGTQPVDPRLAAEGIEVVCLGQQDLLGHKSKGAAALQGIWNIAAAARLGALLASLPRTRTIVHVHGWAKALSPSIAMPIRRAGLPAVYTMHDYFLLCPNGGFYNYQRQHICRLKPLSLACWMTHCDSRGYADKIWRAVRTAVMKYLARLPGLFSDIILVSAFQENVVGSQIPAPIRTHFISNPIDAEDLGPKPDPARGDFLFVGRLSEEKGAVCFAEAARKAGIKPVFVGDGPLAALLKEKYPEAELPGWKSPAEVRRLMRAARALVFPSLWYEAQGMSILEAQALGTPAIVSDACAGREQIEDGVSGLCFASNNTDDLAAKLRLMQNDEAVARMSAAAYRRFWASPPTLDPHIARLLQLYGDMIERRDRI